MGKETIEFLILKDGQLIFYISSKGPHDEQFIQKRLLTAGYLTAILQIIEQTSKGKLMESMELGGKKVLMRKGRNIPLIYVLIVEGKKIKEKRFEKKIETLIDLFEAQYPAEMIANWNGNMNAFSEFTDTALEELK